MYVIHCFAVQQHRGRIVPSYIVRLSGLPFLCPLYIFQYSPFALCILPPFLCNISFQPFPCASVWENTTARFPLFFTKRDGHCLGRTFALSKTNESNYFIYYQLLIICHVCCVPSHLVSLSVPTDLPTKSSYRDPRQDHNLKPSTASPWTSLHHSPLSSAPLPPLLPSYLSYP